jgi:hypothetical protein
VTTTPYIHRRMRSARAVFKSVQESGCRLFVECFGGSEENGEKPRSGLQISK